MKRVFLISLAVLVFFYAQVLAEQTEIMQEVLVSVQVYLRLRLIRWLVFAKLTPLE